MELLYQFHMHKTENKPYKKANRRFTLTSLSCIDQGMATFLEPECQV